MTNNFGEQLKALREKHFPGESLRRVGKRFEGEFGEYFYTQLSRMETGALVPSPDFLSRIERAYKLSPDEMAELISAYTARRLQALNLIPEHHDFTANKLFRKINKDKQK